jgi:hypothetical protein
MKFDLPRAPIGPEEPRYHALRTWRLAVVVGRGRRVSDLAGARRRPARRGQERAQLGPRHPRHQLGGRGGLEARCKAAGGARLPPRLAATRSAPNPRAYPAHPRLDHAGEEENRRKAVEKSENWPRAAATARRRRRPAAQQPIGAFYGLQTHLFSNGTVASLGSRIRKKVRGFWAVGYGSWQWGTWTGSERVGGVLGGVVLLGGQGPSGWAGYLAVGCMGRVRAGWWVGACGQGPSRFVECAKGCSRPPSSRQPLCGALAAAVLSAAVARGVLAG